MISTLKLDIEIRTILSVTDINVFDISTAAGVQIGHHQLCGWGQNMIDISSATRDRNDRHQLCN